MVGSETQTYRYLWVSEPAVAQISPGRLIQDRYEVVDPQIWRDTQPELPPYVPETLPDEALPYLRLYPHRLHVPEVYGWAVLGDEPETAEVMLLENVPIDADGDVYPGIVQMWQQASPVRQVYWLWQILQLWTPLSEQGVASSLLVPDNICVQGWRVWLRELYADASVPESIQDSEDTGEFIPPSPLLPSSPNLMQLGDCWHEWIQTAAAPIVEPLQGIVEQMQAAEVELDAIATQLNQLLLCVAAQLPFRPQVMGATDTGPQRSINEDACYPTASDLQDSSAHPNDLLIPHLSLVCDGIGGHEGGEVASALALQTLKLQLRALMVEISEQPEIVPPELVSDQLAAIIRVVNNMIATQNDSQGRELRERMGTTLVMTLQLPQKIRQPDGTELGNAHELYLASVGDSRAYWITTDYCIQLTIDDDVAAREVRFGRSPYREALKRIDAGALTQALGTKDGQQLHPTIRRLIVEEDGLLLLCSDGLSDRALVEQSWKDYARPVLKGKMSLEDAVKSWINLANEKNGHDNTSIILNCYLVSQEPPTLFDPKQVTPEVQTPYRTRVPSELTAASRALLYGESVDVQPQEVTDVDVPVPSRRRPDWTIILGALAILVVVGVVGFAAWLTFKPPSPQPQQNVPAAPN